MKNDLGGACDTRGGKERCVQSFGGETWQRLLERPGRRWEDDIETNLQEIGWEGMDWMDLAQDRVMWQAVVNVVINLRFYKVWAVTWLARELLACQEEYAVWR